MDSAAQPVNTKTVVSPVEPLLIPIGENQVGEDPRYGDEFTAVKSEIDRLSETDYPEIARRCERILIEEAKDLRVAGYYLMARVFNDGLDGLSEGVELYLELLRRYGGNCHPQREGAQMQAVAWLNNNKLSLFVNKIDLSNDEYRLGLVTVRSHFEALNQELRSLYGGEVATWTSLNPWLEKNMSKVPSTATEMKASEETKAQVVRVESSVIASELVFTRTLERLLDYLADQGDITRLISVSRAMKWSSAGLPENTAGTTRISPPREAVIAAVESAIGPVADESKLLEFESFFMEAGCQYYLDLQAKEMEIARSVGRSELADLIEQSLRQLVLRQPEILNLKFSDGRPFANELTRRTLRQTTSSGEPQAAAGSAQEALDITQRIARLLEKDGNASLGATIDKLSEVEVRDGSEAFRLDLAKLDACLDAGRAEIALPLAQKLQTQVEKYHLAEWDKALALELWDKMLVILQTAEPEDNPTRTTMAELKEKICATDLGFALKLF